MMKAIKLFLSIGILFVSAKLFAQNFEYSVGIHLRPGISFQWGLGVNAGLNYLLSEKYSLLTGLSGTIGELNHDVGYIRGRYTTIVAIEEILQWRNIRGIENLRFGVGIGYYYLNADKHGTSNPRDDDREEISGADWVTYGGLNSMIGLAIPFSDSFSINLGAKYYLIPTWTEGKIFDFSTNDYKYKEEFVWISGLQISLTFVFK